MVEGYQKYAPPTPGSFYRKFEHGRALRGAGIIYRAVLLPISGGGVAIDHALGAVNYRSLRADEVRSTQVNFRRLPKPRVARSRSM